MTYSDMSLVRSTPQRNKTAIGIRDTADEQIARDYGPLKNSTGVVSHKSSQNKEYHGNSSRPTLTLRNFNQQAKRVKYNHQWNQLEQQDLLEIAMRVSGKKIDWGSVHKKFIDKHEWAADVTKDALKQVYRRASVSSTSSSSSAVFVSKSSSTSMPLASSDSTSVTIAQSNSDLGMMNTIEHDRVITQDNNFQSTTAEDETDNIHHTNSANLFSQNDQPSSADTKKYKLDFNWKGYSYDEMKSVVLPKQSPSQNFSEYEDQILLYTSSQMKHRKGKQKQHLDWASVYKDFMDWCRYFTLASMEKCKFVEREQQTLKDRHKNLTRQQRK